MELALVGQPPMDLLPVPRAFLFNLHCDKKKHTQALFSAWRPHTLSTWDFFHVSPGAVFNILVLPLIFRHLCLIWHSRTLSMST
jgi:hypothetical protein